MRAPSVLAPPPPPVSNASAGGGGRRRRRNLTLLQLILFGGAGLVGVAALMAAGAALGLAVAGAGMLAALVLVVWVVAANLIGMERRGR